MVILGETLKSRQNPTVKWAASLSQKKARDEEKTFLAEGEKLTLEAIGAGLCVTHLFLREDRREEWLEKLGALSGSPALADTKVVVLSEEVFEKISTENAPQGVICAIKYLDFFRKFGIICKDGKCENAGASDAFFKNLPSSDRVIALSSVRDPGNLGSVIRSAAAFGVNHLILTSDCADLYNPKTVRAAMGSLFKVKASVVPDAAALVCAVREAGRRVFCAELRDGAMPIGSLGIRQSDCIVIGNEGHGIPEEASALADGSVYIPISEKTESLNASVAAALLIWEQSKAAD